MARFANGWIKLYRSAAEGDIGTNGSCLSLWVTLLTLATWQETAIIWKGSKKTLPPGSVILGARELALRLGCSKDTILKWLNYLVETDRIAIERSPRGSHVTILNWESFQSNEDYDAPLTRTTTVHGAPPTVAQRPTLIEELRREEGRKKKGESAVALPTLATLWNEHRGNLPEVKGCSGTRRKQAEGRWREEPNDTYWVDLITRVTRSSFCRGENDRNWRADFDFLIRPETRHKIAEGKYDDRSGRAVRSVLDDPEVKAELASYERLRREGA